MKIASQLASNAPDNNTKTASAESSGGGFQSVFASANGAPASTVSQAPVSKNAPASTDSRMTETKKKDAAADRTAIPADQSAAASPLTLMPAIVPQPAVLPAEERALAQKNSEEAQGASLSGQFAANTRLDVAALADGAATQAAGRDAVIAKSTAAIKVDQTPMQGAPAVPRLASVGSNTSLHALASLAGAETGALDAAKAKSVQGDGSQDKDSQDKGSRDNGSVGQAASPQPNPETVTTAVEQSISDSMQSSAMSSLTQMPGNLLSESASAAVAKSLKSDSSTAAVKGTAGVAAKGKTTSDDLRGKKSDDPDSNQAAGGGAGGTSFAAKISDAMAAAPRNTTGTQGAVDAAGMPQGMQASGHMAGQVPGQIAGQGPAAAQDGKPAIDTAAQSAAGAQGPAGPDAMPGLSSAHLVQSANSSEMRLGMQSAEFGNISISTSLNHQALSAQISIDHSELGRALAVHLPAIEEKLGTAYGVQAKVELRDSNNPSQAGDSGYSNSGQQAKEQRQSQAGGDQAGAVQPGGIQGVSAAGLARDITLSRMSALASSTVSGAASRLDIRI